MNYSRRIDAVKPGRFEFARQSHIVAGLGRRFRDPPHFRRSPQEPVALVLIRCPAFHEGDPMMKLNTIAMAWVAIAAALPLSAAIAQTPPASAAAETAAIMQADAQKKPLTRKEVRAAQEKADARLCLEFPTQLMVIKCAEKYRLNKRET
jgi:hypothetical protein